MAGGTIDVVIVEDSVSEGELIQRALKTHGFGRGVRLVRDGEAALALLHDPANVGNARCVLVDLDLPKLTGGDVIRRIRADTRTRTIPVVVLTSSREPRDIESCYAAGANAYVVKPLVFEEFVAVIGSIAQFWLRTNQPPS